MQTFRANQLPSRNFPGVNCFGANFPGVIFLGINFPGVNRFGANFPGVIFLGINFPGVNRFGANFPGKSAAQSKFNCGMRRSEIPQ